MNIKTGEIVELSEADDVSKGDLISLDGFSPEMRDEIRKEWSSRNKRPEKTLSRREWIAIARQILRANRSKYQPHVGAKQRSKIEKRSK